MSTDTQHPEVVEEISVDWKNPPTLRDLKKDLEEATPYQRQQVQKINTWLDNLNVTGSALVNTGKGNSKVVPKLIRKQAEWRYAALSEPYLASDDLFDVRPVTWEDREAARQNQLVLSHQFNSVINKVSFIDEYVRTVVDEGTVICKVGWVYEEEEYEEEVPDVIFVENPNLAPVYEQMAYMQQESPSEFLTQIPEHVRQAFEFSLGQGVPYEAVVQGTRMEKKIRVLKNQPTIEICETANVFIDPTCRGDISKASFVIYSFETTLSQLRKDGRYTNLDKILVENSSPLAEPDHIASTGVQDFKFSDEPRKKLVAYEYWGYWDIDGTGIVKPFVATWVGNTLIRLEENPYPDKELPFVVVSYLPVRKSIYGEPDGALLEDNQKIIGAVTRGMIDILGKSANGQTGIRKDMLDATNRRKFQRGDDYEFNAGVDPRQGIYMHTYPEIPASAQFLLQQQNMEAESLTGVKAFSQGLSQQALGDVATAVRGILDAATKRELGILRRLTKGIVDIGRKIIAMNQEFLSEEEVIRVTNDEFITVRRDELSGDFDLRLTISTPEEDEAKARELAFMLQTMGNNMDPNMSKMILADIARLRKMPDLAKRIEDYQPQPDPLMQRKMELEIALMEAEYQKLQAQAQELATSANLNMAKANTEEYKAENIQSDTDMKNLDFVEQESGVKQERELQKHGEQARAQSQMKLLEHQLNREERDKDRQFQLVRDYLSKEKR